MDKKKRATDWPRGPLTLCDPMDYSPPGSSAHGILQARTLEWVAMPFSKVPGASVRNPPVAKVMRKEARHTQRWDRASGVPLEILKHLPLKPESACYVVLSTYSSDINRGLSPNHLFLEKVNLELLDNKSPGHNKSVSIQKPL